MGTFLKEGGQGLGFKYSQMRSITTVFFRKTFFQVKVSTFGMKKSIFLGNFNWVKRYGEGQKERLNTKGDSREIKDKDKASAGIRMEKYTQVIG